MNHLLSGMILQVVVLDTSFPMDCGLKNHRLTGAATVWFGARPTWLINQVGIAKNVTWLILITIPIGSMYGIYDNIYHQYTPNVSIYTIHGSYGIYW